MHSKIFQITTTKVDKECYLNEDTLMQGDNSYHRRGGKVEGGFCGRFAQQDGSRYS